jgi:membrane protein implicated in regulation of membrane protease activity
VEEKVEMVIAWLVLGVVLLAFEMRHMALYALFVAAGAFAAAVVAVFLPDVIAAQVATALIVSVLGIVAVRPKMSVALHRRGGGKLGRGVHGTLVGEEVLTLDVVGDVHQIGHVRLAGERWLAVSGSGSTIPQGSKVLVTGVQGTTLTVWPIDGAPPLPSGFDPPDEASENDPDGAKGDHQ